MNYQDKSLCRIRTVTTFITLTNDKNQWQTRIKKAYEYCINTALHLSSAGYTVQSIRIVTNAFGEYINTSSLQAARSDLQCLSDIINQQPSDGLRIRFAIGEARRADEISLLPDLIKEFGDLCNVCVNVTQDENHILDNELITQSVQAVQRIAEITPRGEGNFNFTVNFNCQPLIPYFPASYHNSTMPNHCVIGLETPDLLAHVLKIENTHNKNKSYTEKMHSYYQSMSNALQYHIDNINNVVKAHCLNQGFDFAGYDSSAAPSKDCTSMTELYEHMGVPYFGASGTVEISALLTRVFKSIKIVDLVGFSGLMLALTEDKGLAQGSINGNFDIRSLLTYSAVCGIGLDTVPIPGDAPTEKIIAIMRDTGTMAYRLNKPLTVRLFPVPGLQAGDITAFESEDLCNCAVLALS